MWMLYDMSDKKIHSPEPQTNEPTKYGSLVSLDEVTRFCFDAFTRVGLYKESARQMADMVTAADYWGYHHCGINTLGRFIGEITNKSYDGNAMPTILRETAATAWVDGNNGMGPVVGNFCMNLAIKKAKKTGIALIVAKGSNDIGISSWYSSKALEVSMVGMVFSNTPPIMVPTRAKEAALGSNPISMAAPGIEGDSFILDMTTTAASFSKIEEQRDKCEPIPQEWALGSDGQLTTDPEVALMVRRLLPLGGFERTSGYKGYTLALMVETLCGILAGAAYGPYIRQPGVDNTPMNLAQSFVVINPECFAPCFPERMSEFMNALRGLRPINPLKPVLVPGDPERIHMKQVDEQGGICYSDKQIKEMEDLAASLKIKPMSLVQLE